MLKSLKVHTFGSAEKPAIVFLHAFPLTSEMWGEQVKLFSKNYYCIVPDLPGFGESPSAPHPLMFEHFVDSVLISLQDLEVGPSIWCGLSMGGYLALRMYERSPELCRALILCDTKASADGNEAKIKRAKAIELLQKSRSEFIKSQWETLVGETSKVNISLKTRFETIVAKVNDAGISAGLVALATRTDCVENLAKIDVPTLILVGEEDKVTPLSDSEFMAKLIRKCKLKMISNAGHLSHLENPIEFNSAVLDFLMSLPSKS